MNVKNYMALSSLFHVFFFFSPHDVLRTRQHEGVPLYRGEGVPYENEDRSATHKDGRHTRPPFPHPTHIALRMSHHPVVKPQSAMVQTNDIVQM